MDLLPLLTSSTLQVIGVPTLGQRLRNIQAAQDIRTDGAQDNDEKINIEEGNQIPLVNEVQNVNEYEILNPNPNQEVEEYERGSEQPEYYCEVSLKGDKSFSNIKLEIIGLTESTQRLMVLPVLSATKVAALPQSMKDIQTLKHGKKMNLRSHLVQQDTRLMELNIPLK